MAFVSKKVYNYTELGFKKTRAPDDLMVLLNEFWEANKDKGVIEWGQASVYHNTWDADPTMVFLEEKSLVGGGYPLRAKVANAVRDIIEEWTGMRQSISSVYGIRVYHDGAILTPHVDRLPLVSSAILNVAQDVDEDWLLEVYDHSGVAYNISMQPGDLVLYESHSIIHGRPFALKGRFYASIFIHFEPIGPLDPSKHVDVYHDDLPYPPYLIPESSWVAEEWLGENEDGWTLLQDGVRLFEDGDLKTIQYAASVNPDILYGNEDWMPLHCAIEHGHFDVVHYLVEQGVSYHSKCSGYDDKLPIDVAREHLHEDDPIISFLEGLPGEATKEDVDLQSADENLATTMQNLETTENLTAEL